MKIYAPEPIREATTIGVDYTASEANADVVIQVTTLEELERFGTSDNTIYIIRKEWTNSPLVRTSNCVDMGYVNFNFECSNNLFFTPNDLCYDNTVNIPVGFTPHTAISQEPRYWADKPRCTDFHYKNRVFWSGNVKNHNFRKAILNHYTNIEDSRFTIKSFDENIYIKPTESSTYTNYLHDLQESDIVLCIRGDVPSVYSLFDVMQSGCVPVFINCFDIGWEKIINVDEHFLTFNLDETSIEDVHSKILELLNDQERLIKMKRNCMDLYETHFKKSKFHGRSYTNFIVAKSIEFHANDYQLNLTDNKLISRTILNYT